MKALVVAAGPSFDPELLKTFEGLVISTDRMLKTCLEYGRDPDYITTLEDSWFGCEVYDLTLFEDVKTKGKMICSRRTVPKFYEWLQEKGYDCTRNENPLNDAIQDVGTFSWFVAWEMLGCDDITFTGLDFVKSTDNQLHSIWQEILKEIHYNFCPKEVKTHGIEGFIN